MYRLRDGKCQASYVESKCSQNLKEDNPVAFDKKWCYHLLSSNLNDHLISTLLMPIRIL